MPMISSITQRQEYGCGVACFAFVTNLSYDKIADWLGQKQASSSRFYVKDFREALIRFGLSYSSKHIKSHNRDLIYKEGAIVLIRRSRLYPAGHYLVRYQGKWMDPWINLPKEKSITKAQSGFRKRLPGAAMYVLYPE